MFGPREGSSRRPEERGRAVVSRFKNIVCVIDLVTGVLLFLNLFRNRIFVKELCFLVPCFRQYFKFVSTGFDCELIYYKH